MLTEEECNILKEFQVWVEENLDLEFCIKLDEVLEDYLFRRKIR